MLVIFVFCAIKENTNRETRWNHDKLTDSYSDVNDNNNRNSDNDRKSVILFQDFYLLIYQN
jgi:hypothetical protein